MPHPGSGTNRLAKAVVGGMSLLVAINDGYITHDEAACNYITSWKPDGLKSKITIGQLATHTSGLADAEGNEDEQNIIKSKGLNSHFDLSGWREQFWRREPDPFSLSRDSIPVIIVLLCTKQKNTITCRSEIGCEISRFYRIYGRN